MKSISMLLITSVLLLACNQKSQSGKESAAPATVEKASTRPAFAAPDSFKMGVAKVYEGYLGIQNALARDDFQMAKDAFGPMHGILHMIQSDGLDSAAKAYWDTSNVRFMGVLHPMASSKDIGEMRIHLGEFTSTLVDVLEKFAVKTQSPVYLFHCPMTKDGKGADWMQSDTTIANPFYGKSMPKCGNYVRNIKS